MGRHPVSRGRTVRSTALAGVTVLVVGASQGAMGQQVAPTAESARADNPQALEEIVVSGYRRSLEASLDIKRDEILSTSPKFFSGLDHELAMKSRSMSLWEKSCRSSCTLRAAL